VIDKEWFGILCATGYHQRFTFSVTFAASTTIPQPADFFYSFSFLLLLLAEVVFFPCCYLFHYDFDFNLKK